MALTRRHPLAHAAPAAPAIAAPRGAKPNPGRTVRVLVLAALVLFLSLADLHLTLLHAASGGLAEANPLARAIMRHGQAPGLAVWKLLSLIPLGFTLVRFRKTLAAEIGAWLAAAVMLGVVALWYEYSTYADVFVQALPHLETGIEPRWVAVTSR